MSKVRKCFFKFSVLLLAGVSLARADYSQHPRAQVLMNKMVVDYGMDRNYLEAVFRKASKEQSILDSMSTAAEKTKTWPQYRAHFIVEQRIAAGIKFWQENRAALTRAQQQYGVPAELIVAILGVETNYGTFTGRASVLNSLSTLAFEHPTRTEFFGAELEQYLLLVRERGWQAEQPTGSYAGAMGYAQFMPSNYRTLAVDFDENGQIDLQTAVDAIGSIANYFQHHGWQTGAPVTDHLQTSAGFDTALQSSGLQPEFTIAQLDAGGYHTSLPLEPETLAALVYLDGGDAPDEYWLGLHNFYVISRYNPRSKYAMAVYQLSQEIKARA